MNKLGKFLLIPLILILSAVGIFLSGRLLTARNKVTKDYADALQKNLDNAKQIETNQLLRDDVLAKITRENLGWDKTYQVPQIAMPPQGQQFQYFNTTIGNNNGLKVEQSDQGPVAPRLFAFAQRGEQMQYVGEMAAVDVRVADSSLKPTWRYTQLDLQMLYQNANSPWRFRSEIPQKYRSLIEALNARAIQSFQHGQRLTQQIKDQDGLKKLADDELNVRKGELLGNPDIERTEDRPELAIGLVAGIEEVEELRNQLQADVDDLRRAIKVEMELQESTTGDLQQLVGVQKDPATKISQK